MGAGFDDEVGDGPSGPPPLQFCHLTSGPAALAALPTRHDFIVGDERGRRAYQATCEKLEQRSPVLFLPSDVADSVWFPPRARDAPGAPPRMRYQLNLFGITQDGAKTHVIVRDAPVRFGVFLPAAAAADATAAEQWRYTLAGLFQEHGLERVEAGEGYPLKGYRETPRPLVWVYFANLKDRNKAIGAARKAGLETASDDPGTRNAYCRLLAREAQIPLCGWLTLSGYEYYRGGGAEYARRPPPGAPPDFEAFLAAGLPTGEEATGDWRGGAQLPHSPQCRHVLVVPWRCIAPLVNPLHPDEAVEKRVSESYLLTRDRALLVGYDIETWSRYKGRGTPPDPSVPGDTMFMLCATAHWRGDPAPLACVCLTTQEAAPDARWTTVVCGGEEADPVRRQASLLVAWGEVLRRWAPEYTSTFNGGGYDDPWIVETARDLGQLVRLDALASALPAYKATTESLLQWQYTVSQRIKVGADRTHFISYYKVPGAVPIDVRVVYMQLYPRMGQTSLKAFLAKAKLPSKADMPYHLMWRYYEDAVKVAAWQRGRPPPEGFEAPIAEALEGGAPSAARAAEHMRRVAHYCVIDALRCQELLVRSQTVQAVREKCNQGFLPFADGIFYADGMKVRNQVFAYCYDSGRVRGAPLLSPSRCEEREAEGKYVGAYVVPPERGLEEDLPVPALDFASLYPSIIQAYNFSPEMMLGSEAEAQAYERRGEVVRRTEIPHRGETLRGWFVWHQNREEKWGVFPRALRDLFGKRARLKAALKKYDALLERVRSLFFDKTGDTTEDVFQTRRTKCERDMIQNLKKTPNVSDKYAHAEACLEFVEGLYGKSRAEALPFFQEVEYQRMSANIKQMAVKVYMNTFYGETGNSRSVLFELVLAASVTTMGQYNLQLMKTFLEEKRYRIKYGDTDSLYFTCPPETYQAAEAAYRDALRALELPTSFDEAVALEGPANGQLAAESAGADDGAAVGSAPQDTWLERAMAAAEAAGRPVRAAVAAAYRALMDEKVRLTIVDIERLRQEVNARLQADNGTTILKMSYEEVLCPVTFTGKKKYFGIAHEHVPNFDVSRNDIFIKGLDNRGQTPLEKEIALECMWVATRLHPPGARRPLIARIEEVVRTQCSDIASFRAQDGATASGRWKLEDFVQTDAWKPDRDNKSVQCFMRRMRARHELQLHENREREARGEDPVELKYLEPEPGARFSYLIVERDAGFTLQGFTRTKPAKGDLMEYVHVAKENNLRINASYYLTAYIVGICARFICYDARFLKGVETSPAKVQDEVSQRLAKKHLTELMKTLIGGDRKTVQRLGLAYKKAYKAVAASAAARLQGDLGDAAGLLLGGRTPATKAEAELDEAARARAGIVDYELFLEGEGDGAASAAQRLSLAAEAVAAGYAAALEEPAEGAFGRLGVTDRAVRAFGIDRSPEGRARLFRRLELYNPPPHRVRLRRGALIPAPLDTWTRLEAAAAARAMARIEDNVRTVGRLCERLRAALEEAVAARRETAGAAEDEDDAPGGDDALPDFRLAADAGERAAAAGVFADWQVLVALALGRKLRENLVARLRALRDQGPR